MQAVTGRRPFRGALDGSFTEFVAMRVTPTALRHYSFGVHYHYPHAAVPRSDCTGRGLEPQELFTLVGARDLPATRESHRVGQGE